jgi:para-aminobenzoate synthetase
MKTLVIDNYDSFTYNLVHLLAELNQEEPIVVRNDEVTWAEISHWKFDNIVISPGPGRPDREGDFGVSKDAICHAAVPLLGVCLGHQGIAAFAGGIVARAPAPMHGRISAIRHLGMGLFQGLPQPLNVARYHSLVAARPLPASLVETAWTEDGLVMALAHRDRLLWGVQFHPESIITDRGRTLLENFREITHRSRSSFRSFSSIRKEIEPSEVPRRRAFWREIPYALDCEATFVSLFANASSAFWLDSSLVEPGRSRWSYMGDASGPNAALLQYRTSTKSLSITEGERHRIERESILNDLDRAAAQGPPVNVPPCPFTGGYIGWLGYELRNECGSPTNRQAATPDALFIRADRFVAVDHVAGRSFVVAIDHAENCGRARSWVDDIVARLGDLKPTLVAMPDRSAEIVQFSLDRDRATYLADIEQCLAWIGEGETYQVCLTNEISCEARCDSLALYRVMRRVNPAPYAAFLKWPGGAVLSASPERFLSVDGLGKVETKPIKGTIARDDDEERDRKLALHLRENEKDRAENVMIVDLLRNDLSRVCEPGSVVVPKLFAVESYATVHQLVSTVRGQLTAGRNVVDLIRATFPGGSMTGAPKIRTLQLIDMLERRARGVYSGAFGWLGYDGAADLSIVIRTIVAAEGRLSMGVGGGIVAQSTPEAEFEEMLLKARASIKAICIACTGSFEPRSYRLIGADMAALAGQPRLSGML